MTAETLLRLENIVKTFPGAPANRGVNLEVRRGEIHALLGENGAGKTVLMSQLYGLYAPDSGRMLYAGKPLTVHSPRDAIRHRIGMVHQHFMLVPTLTVTENVVLGQYRFWEPLRGLDRVEARIRELSREFGLEIHPQALVRDLSVGEQQRVEILKALYHGVDLLILDEPTAVLTPQETGQLLKLLRSLADRGLTVIFITHKLEEVMQVSDRVTILRDGREVGTLETRATNPRELARLMVGREVLMDLPRAAARPGEPVLEVERLEVRDGRGLPAVRGVSFSVRAGEIVGVAGVSGNGQSELALALAGLLPASGGSVRLCGRALAPDTPPQVRGQLGLAHIPEDRHRLGVVLPFSLAENFILHDYARPPFARRGVLALSEIARHAARLVQTFSIRAAGVERPISQLSGGNQQKAVVARELERKPRCLLVNQPTRGIDIGATEFVLQQLLAQRAAGVGVLLISTELEELLAVSDRILVMFEGRLMGELPADRARVDEIGLMMAGQRMTSG